MNEFRTEFIQEADELLDSVFADLESLADRNSRGSVRRQLIDRIFRTIHTVKGAAAAADLVETAKISHEFESMLDHLRMGRVALDDEIITVLSDVAVAISQTIHSSSENYEILTANESLVERLRRVFTSRQSSTGSDRFREPENWLARDIANALNQYERQKLRESLYENLSIYLITIQFDLDSFDEGFRDLSSQLNKVGEIVSSLPGIDDGQPEKIGFRILYASPLPQDELRLQLCNFTDLELRTLRSEVQRSNGHSTSNQSLASARNPVSAPTGVAVRVPVRNVDEITLAGQGLMDETIAALDLALSAISDKSTRSELEIRSDLIRAGFADLKSRLLGLRMVPLGPTFARAVRSAKSAARHLDIEVNFETSGGDVHVDKAVAEAIAEPLLHILRNAVSHGIESALQREEIGKPSNGRVKIDAASDGDRITISVADDGRGIDWQNIARSAIAQGFVSASEVLDVSQAQALLFSPGFSTAETVSRVAGRGVGLDIVERSVNSIGGEVRVKSEPNRGATFEILIPARFS